MKAIADRIMEANNHGQDSWVWMNKKFLGAVPQRNDIRVIGKSVIESGFHAILFKFCHGGPEDFVSNTGTNLKTQDYNKTALYKVNYTAHPFRPFLFPQI